MLLPDSQSGFLSRYWQKQPLLIRRAIAQVAPALPADELAWLATQQDVEARLVHTRHANGDCYYDLHEGPFEEISFTGLPQNDWTLLVNDVDKHLPDFRQYLDHVDFIPDWRIDDLMVSFAATGGGVGPHVDNYDVFLVQGAGRRRWMLGEPGRTEPDESSNSLSLVKPFEVVATYDVVEGDVLYLPPGVPHWGVAAEPCLTYSIGMRAPSAGDLGLTRNRLTEADDGSSRGDPVFYTDADLSVNESLAGCIHPQAVRRIREQGLLPDTLTDFETARILGCTVTDPKAWLMPEPPPADEIIQLLAVPADLATHGMARIGWYESLEQAMVFVNGVAREVDRSLMEPVRRRCDARAISATDLGRLLDSHEGAGLARWMLREGLFDAGHGVS